MTCIVVADSCVGEVNPKTCHADHRIVNKFELSNTWFVVVVVVFIFEDLRPFLWATDPTVFGFPVKSPLNLKATVDGGYRKLRMTDSSDSSVDLCDTCDIGGRGWQLNIAYHKCKLLRFVGVYIP